ncbi:MAG: hypothetical protein AAFX50_05490, partial [Acidobacteriota bacterium]
LGVGSRPEHEVISTLIHEVAHLMHRRALGPALPPWLDEGLSDELANLYVAADGTLSARGWSGKRVEEYDRVTYEGAPASLRVSVRTVHSGQSPKLPQLLSYDWRQFVVSSRSRLHYDLSAFFLRFLLDEPRRAAAFRTFLRETAQGEPISPEGLRQRLDRPWPEVQRDFEDWLVVKAGQTAFGTAPMPATSTPDSASGSAA